MNAGGDLDSADRADGDQPESPRIRGSGRLSWVRSDRRRQRVDRRPVPSARGDRPAVSIRDHARQKERTRSHPLTMMMVVFNNSAGRTRWIRNLRHSRQTRRPRGERSLQTDSSSPNKPSAAASSPNEPNGRRAISPNEPKGPRRAVSPNEPSAAPRDLPERTQTRAAHLPERTQRRARSPRTNPEPRTLPDRIPQRTQRPERTQRSAISPNEPRHAGAVSPNEPSAREVPERTQAAPNEPGAVSPNEPSDSRASLPNEPSAATRDLPERTQKRARSDGSSGLRGEWGQWSLVIPGIHADSPKSVKVSLFLGRHPPRPPGIFAPNRGRKDILACSRVVDGV